jgi:hypothetical protein
MRLEEAQNLIKPYESDIVASFQTAWAKWQELKFNNSEVSKPLKPRTRACYINDFVVDEIKKRFSGLPEITLSEKYGFLLLTIQDLISIRFKKLDKRGRTNNIRTHQQRELFVIQTPLPSIVPGIKVTAGYQLDILQTEIIAVRILYEKNKLIWSYDIAAAGELSTVAAIPLDLLPTDSSPKRRVQAKIIEQPQKSVNNK